MDVLNAEANVTFSLVFVSKFLFIRLKKVHSRLCEGFQDCWQFVLCMNDVILMTICFLACPATWLFCELTIAPCDGWLFDQGILYTVADDVPNFLPIMTDAAVCVCTDVEWGGETAFPRDSKWVNPELELKYGPWSECAEGHVAAKAKKVSPALDHGCLRCAAAFGGVDSLHGSGFVSHFRYSTWLASVLDQSCSGRAGQGYRCLQSHCSTTLNTQSISFVESTSSSLFCCVPGNLEFANFQPELPVLKMMKYLPSEIFFVAYFVHWLFYVCVYCQNILLVPLLMEMIITRKLKLREWNHIPSKRWSSFWVFFLIRNSPFGMKRLETLTLTGYHSASFSSIVRMWGLSALLGF